MPRIIFLITYTGKSPWYFLYFLHSCRHNPTVDFLIFTDNNVPNHESSLNVKIIPNSLDQFKTEAAMTVGFEVSVESEYKLFDFKPAYGYIFSDFIGDYDFWGYCDMDVIFGNIHLFLTDKLLNGCDIVSAHYDSLTDFLTLFGKKTIPFIFTD